MSKRRHDDGDDDIGVIDEETLVSQLTNFYFCQLSLSSSADMDLDRLVLFGLKRGEPDAFRVMFGEDTGDEPDFFWKKESLLPFLKVDESGVASFGEGNDIWFGV
jgi:predicted GNAT superfamily acetyltransferase